MLVGKNLLANAGDVRDAGLIPGSGRSPGGGHGNPLQDSCLGNPLDRGPWRASVQRVTRSRTRLSTQVPGIRGAALPPLHTKVVLITTCYTLPLFSSWSYLLTWFCLNQVAGNRSQQFSVVFSSRRGLGLGHKSLPAVTCDRVCESVVCCGLHLHLWPRNGPVPMDSRSESGPDVCPWTSGLQCALPEMALVSLGQLRRLSSLRLSFSLGLGTKAKVVHFVAVHCDSRLAQTCNIGPGESCQLRTAKKCHLNYYVTVHLFFLGNESWCHLGIHTFFWTSSCEENLLYITRQPSISMDYPSMDSTNLGLKLFGEKILESSKR